MPPSDLPGVPPATGAQAPSLAFRPSRALGLVAGMALDAVLGDPRRGHPVALYGTAVSALERRVHADSRARGALFTLIAVAAPALAAAAVTRSHGTRRTGGLPSEPARGDRPTRGDRGGLGSGFGEVAAVAAATWAVVGGASLSREALAMAEALERGDLAAARERLPHLCGRDPSKLGPEELARATVESVAENTSDAVVAPLFWGAVAGVPGLVAYRAVNTLDAMVGHRSARYERFGWASARLDDLANLAPARITGVLAALAAPLAGGSARRALAVLRRDGHRHPSPNAGRCEAAFAGALGVRLGGTNVYAGRTEHRPELGEGPRPGVADIRRTVRLARAVSAAATALAAGAAVLRSREARAAVRAPRRGGA
ncbi:cobalamin biosynthesis protein [Bailinhaonella thermotolerans]|uniref:Cobalamin biosynthesis protein CobD n=1 Tax=Bailinhaonella thermotolerans TaxID=1070861 RepID=A0A3A4ATD4_9ACTN|nr:cobalamin biosynthesis protein [Bailinhaonella thermotolerans]RJL22822.1 cobalamin biosynthesis protein [Bailinhaonella thermotolerans]